jgi:hypothetical protein
MTSKVLRGVVTATTIILESLAKSDLHADDRDGVKAAHAWATGLLEQRRLKKIALANRLGQ